MFHRKKHKLSSCSTGNELKALLAGNPAPVAIGETEMSSTEAKAAGGKGKFLRILTVYRDALWDVAAAQPSRPLLIPNAGYLAGPGRYCSPRHRMPLNSINEGSKLVG